MCPLPRAASPLQFDATFDAPDDFYDRFEYGFSGLSPLNTPGAPPVTEFHGDHNDACEAPTTSARFATCRTATNSTISQVFWHCAPGDDPTKGHVMTGVDTLGYNIAWFSPKQMFTDVTAGVLGHQRDRDVDAASGRRCSSSAAADVDALPIGSWLGRLRSRLHVTGLPPGSHPTPGSSPKAARSPGSRTPGGTFRWFQDQDTWTGQSRWLPRPATATTDKADALQALPRQPAEQHPSADAGHAGAAPRTFDLPGQIPQHAGPVVFQDDNYDPVKDERYNPTC